MELEETEEWIEEEDIAVMDAEQSRNEEEMNGYKRDEMMNEEKQQDEDTAVTEAEQSRN